MISSTISGRIVVVVVAVVVVVVAVVVVAVAVWSPGFGGFLRRYAWRCKVA